MSQNIKDAPAEAGNASGADFANFGLPETMLATLAREGLVEPTPIQVLSIPPLLDGKDLIGLAQTGTGKTAAFLLPLITQLGFNAAVRAGQPPKALILGPTRELANQISQNVKKLSADLNIRHIAIFGGARYDTQIRGLRRGVDIVVATPGRLQDLMERGAFDPCGITHFVMDEADHMLDLGFYPAIKRIAASLPGRRQTMLFSATMPQEIEALGRQFLRDPARVKAPQSSITADNVTQHVTLLKEGDKRDRLCDILRDKATGQALIFVRTKRRADALAKFLYVRGFAVDALHGDMRQTLRQKVLRNFRGGNLQALIATDVAARGIDVAGLSHVVNFDLTDTPEAYVHRIGRTGRAGLGGLALSFCSPDEQHKLAAIISLVGPLIKLFEADGTRVEDFRAASVPSRKRRSGTKSRGHKFAERKPAQPAGKTPQKRIASNDQVHDPKNCGTPRRKPDDYMKPKAHAKLRRRRQLGKGGKHVAGKNSAPRTQTVFSKRPNFTSQLSFSDNAQRSGKDASTKPTFQTNKSSAGKTGGHFSDKSPKPHRRDATAGTQYHVPNAKKRARNPEQARKKSPKSGTAKSGLTKLDAFKSDVSRSRQGGYGRLKRRTSS